MVLSISNTQLGDWYNYGRVSDSWTWNNETEVWEYDPTTALETKLDAIAAMAGGTETRIVGKLTEIEKRLIESAPNAAQAERAAQKINQEIVGRLSAMPAAHKGGLNPGAEPWELNKTGPEKDPGDKKADAKEKPDDTRHRRTKEVFARADELRENMDVISNEIDALKIAIDSVIHGWQKDALLAVLTRRLDAIDRGGY